MNEESHDDIAVHYGILDLIERREHRLKIRLVQAKGEVRAGQRTRNGNSLALHGVATGCLARDKARSIAIAHGRAVWEQRVAIAEIRVGVNRDRRNLELSAHGALIERLDVLQLVDVGESFRIDLPRGERIEHERVVGIGAVGDVNDGHHFSFEGVRAAEIAASMSGLCRRYSPSPAARSVASAAMSLASNARARAALPSRRAALAASMSPSRCVGRSRRIMSACARARVVSPPTSPRRPRSYRWSRLSGARLSYAATASGMNDP